MRIGLFTDTYRPTINGITYVVDTLKNELEAAGHEVYVFCPARSLRPNKKDEGLTLEEDHVVRLPSFPSGFFDDFDFTLIFPPVILKQIKDMQFDIIHIFTPSQVGLLGINAAIKHDTPFVVQHCTDLYEFSENYPNVLPGVLALVGIVFPMSIKLKGQDVREIIKLHRPRRHITKWNKDIISRAITILYSKADAAIALSRKSQKQLQSWQDKAYRYKVTLMPNGVDAIPVPSAKRLNDFRKKWNLSEDDEIYGFVGRLAEEKNLPVLIKAFEYIGRDRPHAKLLFVGDFEYRKELEKMAAKSKYANRIVFTGFINREDLGVAYAALSVFAFPSLKDTQGWVLHEAAHAGKPIVIIDRDLSEVLQDGKNGYYAKNSAADVARKVADLLKSPAKRAKFGAHSKVLAAKFGQAQQAQKLVSLYEQVIAKHGTKKPVPKGTLTKLKALYARLLQS